MVTNKKPKTKKAASSGYEMEKLVAKMLEDDELPEGLGELDALAFARSLASYRANAMGTADYSNRINVAAWGDADGANELLTLMDEARGKLTGDEMEDAMSAINIHLDYSVMTSDPFNPVIMPNGSLLIRNHHRVLGLTDSPQLNLKVSAQELRAELESILEPGEFDGSLESRLRFFLIHRDTEDRVYASQNLPEELSPWGQTLIFVGPKLDLSKSKFLAQSDIAAVREDSFGGIVVLRTFRQRTLVYGIERCSDSYDTVLEEYPECLFEALDERMELNVCLDYSQLVRRVSERTLERLEHSNIKKFHSFMRCYVDHMIASENNSYSYAREKLHQIISLQPIFACFPDRPVHSYTDFDLRWDLSESLNHRAVFIELHMDVFESLDTFEREFELRVKAFLKSLKLPKHEARLSIADGEYFSEECLVKLGTKEARKWVQDTAMMLRAEKEGSGYEEDEDLFGSVTTSTNLVLLFDHQPDLLIIDKAMKRATEEQGFDIEVHLPYMGFSQGYECGGYDSGNVRMLLTPEEQS